jgi:phosphate transport system permease protein
LLRLSQAAREVTIKWLLRMVTSTAILVVLLIFLFLGKEALPIFKEVHLSNLFSKSWYPVSFEKEQFGIIPLLAGSLVVTIMATLLVIPFGVTGAIYISELARSSEREILKPFVEILAGIPSVVLGFFGLVVLGPLIKEIFNLNTGLTALTGAVLLAFMAVPTVMSISEDAIRAVPTSYKEASLALGATRLQTIWRVTVPSASSGIVAATMLGIGRVIGETMAVMMVTGNAAIIPNSPFDSVRTMTATIAAEMGEVPFGSTHYHALFLVGLVLLLLTFLINLVAQRVLAKRAGLE